MRYIRSRFNGDIYEWSEQLSVHPQCEEITEHQAYPERFVEELVKKRQGRPGLNLSTEVVPEPDMTPPELGRQAAKGFPK